MCLQHLGNRCILAMGLGARERLSWLLESRERLPCGVPFVGDDEEKRCSALRVTASRFGSREGESMVVVVECSARSISIGFM